MNLPTNQQTVILTGATGYVGNLILKELSRLFGEVRCITRDPSKLSGLPKNALAVKADLANHKEISAALKGAHIAYYFVHSLAETDDFEEAEAKTATNFADAASRAQLSKIIYLSALAQSSKSTSSHMTSRWRVGEILRTSGIPVTEFRASIVIGAGSMPFEAVRALVERLPAMVIPRWVRQPLQPIAAADLSKYLIASASNDDRKSTIFEIGGADVVTYLDLIKIYARSRGLKRLMVNIPFISPSLSSHWLRIFTPAHFRIGRRIVDSALHKSVVSNDLAKIFNIKVMTTREAVASAISNEEEELEFIEANPPVSNSDHGKRNHWQSGTRFMEKRITSIQGDLEYASNTIKLVGGSYGWFWATWLWRVRGALDRLVGGVGYRMCRPLGELKIGDKVDFWVVERSTENRLTLRAEMRLPGDALFDLKVVEKRIPTPDLTPGDSSNSFKSIELIQTVTFNPKGLIGYAYWFGLLPIHTVVFDRMHNRMVDRIQSHGQRNL